ncbi:MAG: tetratricopeptide repeat protein [Elusimicrobiaceae bacterium]|nr:tetratricopeptide repeat protein [Elusimicrobiaceae bacterium]
MRKVFCFIAAVCFAAAGFSPLQAEIKLPPDVMQYATTGINGVYTLDFDTANENIQKVFDLYPDHPFAHFGNAMVAWARYEYEFELSDGEQQKKFEKILDDSIAGIKRWIKQNPDDPNGYMGIGALYGLRAMFSMRTRSWVTAYFSGRKAISNLEKSMKLDPTYYDAYFGLGIYNYFAGTLPNVIKILAKIVAIKGNVDEGVRQLNIAREKATFTSDSAKLILIEIQNTRGNKYYAPDKSLQYIQELHAKFPANPLMHYVVLICQFENEQYDEVLAGGQEFLSLIGSNKFYKEIYIPRAYTAIGTSYMAKGEWEKARDAFEQSRKASANQAPSRWGVWNEYRLGQVYDVLGQREQAIAQYKKVLSFKDKWGFDSFAKAGLKTPWQAATGKDVGPLPPQQS